MRWQRSAWSGHVQCTVKSSCCTEVQHLKCACHTASAHSSVQHLLHPIMQCSSTLLCPAQFDHACSFSHALFQVVNDVSSKTTISSAKLDIFFPLYTQTNDFLLYVLQDINVLYGPVTCRPVQPQNINPLRWAIPRWTTVWY